MVKGSECFSPMTLTEKGYYIPFYKGPEGAVPTESRSAMSSSTELGTSQLSPQSVEMRANAMGQIWGFFPPASPKMPQEK